MSASSQGVQKPATLIERRVQAEAEYEKLFARFGTHNILEWEGPDGEIHMSDVPPYCYRFDEFFGASMTMLVPHHVKPQLDKMFPNPDSLDLDYLQNILFELSHIPASKSFSYSTKIPGLVFGSLSSPNFHEKLAIVRHWIEEAQERINNANILADKSLHSSKDQLSRADAYFPSANLFLNGFSSDKMTYLLVSLGILEESGQHTADSKPRNWRAVIEALRINKRMVSSDSTGLYKFLVKEYDYPFKKRTIQDIFNAKNILTQQIFIRACALLRADE